MRKIRILIIEDHRVLRDGIADMLNKEADMSVVAAIGSGNNIFSKAVKLKPHVILLDMSLKYYKEASVVEAIREKIPETKVIGMGLIPTQSDMVEFVEAGVSGFIMKDALVKEFITTVRLVALGTKVLPPLLTGSLFSHVIAHALKQKKRNLSAAVRMTKRERDIIVLIADGMSNKEIARRLNIATHTVKSHVHNILEKLALHSRLQIAKFIYEEHS
jgi:DNA-binding NarL/FixJ family response regulator